jgi:hypothetical protein
MTYTHSFAIGTVLTIAGMVNLQALATPVRYPKTAYHPYAGVVDLEDNTQRGVGLPVVTWHWTSLPQAQRDVLRTFCPNNTASVYIRTRTNDASAEFKYYSAVMVWPSLAEEYDAATRQGFDVTFRNLVVHADPVS